MNYLGWTRGNFFVDKRITLIFFPSSLTEKQKQLLNDFLNSL